MPVTRIEARRTRTRDEVQALIEAVYTAQREALRLPEWDRQIRYTEYHSDFFQIIPGRTDNYVLVEITLFSGRSLDTKKSLYQNIVQRLGQLGISETDVTIILYEVPAENWGIHGGLPASEVDLGFKVDI